MGHFTTTFDRINQLYAEERALLDRAYDPDFTPADRQRLKEIGRELMEKYWPKRRAELTFAVAGPPRLVSSPEPLDKRRRTAFGIAPLPASGGD